MNKTTILTLFLLSTTCIISAQSEKKHKLIDKEKEIIKKVEIVRHITDSLINSHSKIKTDTAYVSRPSQPLTIQVREDVAGELFHLRAPESEANKEYFLSSSMKFTFGVSINYRGLSICASINPKKLFKKTSDSQYLMNYYNNKYGADLSYNNLKKFSGRSDKVSIEDAKSRSLSANVYYVFNNRHFSYPAAFTHTWIQKHSAGSFIVATSYYNGHVDGLQEIDIQNAAGNKLTAISMQHTTIGFGYAYNYVPTRRWLLHASFQPSLIIQKNYRQTYTDDEGIEYNEKTTSKRLNVFGVGRLATIYNVKNYFYGYTAVIQLSSVGKHTNFQTINTKWRARLYCGIRL